MPSRLIRVLLGLAMLATFGGIAAGPVLAQGGDAVPAADAAPATLPEPRTQEALRDLVARLSDAEARELLLRELDRQIAAERAPEQDMMMATVDAEATALRERWRRMLAAADQLPGVPEFFAGRLIGDRGPSVLLAILVFFVIILAGGLVAEWLFRRVTGEVCEHVTAARPEAASARLGYLALDIVLDLLAIMVFVLGAVGTFLVFYRGFEPTRWTILICLTAIVAIRLASLLSRVLFAPHAPGLRLVPVADDAARLLHRRAVGVAAFLTIAYLSVELLRGLGLDPDAVNLIGLIAAVAFIVVLLWLLWRSREPVARLIRGDPEQAPAAASSGQRLRQLLASIWHVLATIYVLAILALSEITAAITRQPAGGRAILSLLLPVAIVLADAVLTRAIDAYIAARRARWGEEADAFGRLMRRALHIVLIIVALLIFAGLWGANLFNMAAEGVGEQALSTLLDIGLTLLVAWLGWEIIKIGIDRRLALEAPADGHAPGEGEGGGAGASRLRTLLPLLRSFLFVTLIVIVVMIVLSSLGVNIGPLLAGAGVVGLAIGFGAQTLVKDIVSGIFFLLDDAFRLGEYIDVGSAKGTVEKISIRSLRLRHHRGALNTVPYGEIQILTNHSRDWVIMKLEFQVPADTDLSKVKKIFKKIGAELKADPTIGPNLLDPLKSQGVLRIEDSVMVIRGKFMARPGEQFVIRREVYQRVQKAFEENGIEFAKRQVAVYVPPEAGGEGPGEPAISGAAAAALSAREKGPAAAE
jgi:moderate conductance mechanosensitive channel